MLKKKWFWILIIVIVLVGGAGWLLLLLYNPQYIHPSHPNGRTSHADRGCPAG